ncbi:hypothetical protein NKH14_23000 [Mesorhizobium sp. M1380]|uniref:hypothetical protein n=1 Tax=Mesorhizobium sp. M1380 TaxID=2957093 RepID=UPI003336AD59
MGLFSGFFWRHHDLCLFHRTIDSEIRQRGAALTRFIDENAPLPPEELRDESFAIWQSRIEEAVFSHEAQTRSMESFSDQLLMVALWSMVEQFCGRALIETERSKKCQQGLESPHQWHLLVRRFKDLGADLDMGASYAAANQCRVLNNKIKHVGRVDPELAAFSRFAGSLNERLDDMQFDLQYYSDGVHEFVSWTFYTADNLIAGRPLDA